MDNANAYSKTKNFICGVVEGFYGRPWTTEQRKDLFVKMNKWEMDCYLYAPKDDYKHRAYWRELYTVEEADHLGSLITAAKENNIQFIYAISPGLDIVYSSAKDVTALKRKLEQVTQLGCDAFAILFDDIDPEMTRADKEMFKSFAHAQVSVTNEAFQHVNVSTFLFCPTQYCATRAVPDVATSEYLKTIGEKLDLQIDIMWTGPKVISKDITLDSIEEVTEVMRRPPVIWDNLHANDYDQKRLFLGPYSGRSPRLIPKLRGVLTNPNCEYGANFVAIHTFARWSKCVDDVKKKNEPLNSDVKLETENEEGNNVSHIPDNLDPLIYHPDVALKSAVNDWLEEFNKGRSVWGPIVKPQIVSVPVPLIPSVNTCITVTSTTTTSPSPSRPLLPSAVPSVQTVNCSARELNHMHENGGNPLIPCPSTTMMNSLAAHDKILRADSGEAVPPVSLDGNIPHVSETPASSESDITEIPAKESNASQGLEPMDTATPPVPSPPENMSTEREDVPMAEGSDRTSGMSSPDEGVGSGNTSVSVMNLDNEVELTGNASSSRNTPTLSTVMQVETSIEETKTPSQGSELMVEDLYLLCDLFYLPYEHGTQGLQIMLEFQWLKTNANVIAGIAVRDRNKPEVLEWYQRAEKFNELAKRVNSLANKLNEITNRELLYEIYPYVWDIRGVICLLNSYVKWLALGEYPGSVCQFVHGSYTWFSKGWREAFMSGDQEAWVIRGGLTSELQRLIPVDRGTDLFMYKAPVVPSSQTFTIRPYRSSDEESVYKVCLMTYRDGISAVEEFSDYPKLAGDIKMGGYLALNPDINFVVEDESETIVGCALAVMQAKEFRRNLNHSWMEMLRKTYPLPSEDCPSYTKEVISSIHTDIRPVPEDIQSTHPAELRFAIIAPLADPSVPKRLMTCILAALRANGIFGCFLEVSSHDTYYREFFKKLGFIELDDNFMGRSF